MTYGYCRISRKTQNISRQVQNIQTAYPQAKIKQEVYTGTKLQGRKVLDSLIREVKEGDTVVFDSASRMARNAEEGMALYEELYNRGVHLVFLKEPHINSEVYRQAVERQVQMSYSTGNSATDQFLFSVIAAINQYSIALAKQQVQIVFDQAQKEVDDLHQRTAEGIRVARDNGKQIGRAVGAEVTTKKYLAAKEAILKHSKTFGGTLNDSELQALVGVSRNTLYKYKALIKEELQ